MSNMMVDVELFGGNEDGKIIQVSQQTLAQGKMRKTKPFNVRAFEKSPELPEFTEPPYETWLIRKWYNPVLKTFKVKAIEEGMWKRLNP